MLNILINSKLRGCIDYEFLVIESKGAIVVEEYKWKDLLKVARGNHPSIVQFRLRFILFYFALIFCRHVYLDFRTLSVRDNKIKRAAINLIIGLFIKYHARSICDVTARNAFNAPPRLTYGLGTYCSRSSVSFVYKRHLKFVYVGSTRRTNSDELLGLLFGLEPGAHSLDIFASENFTPRLDAELRKVFASVRYHPWIPYKRLHTMLSEFDVGINYVDPEIYGLQVPLKILDYACAGIPTLTNLTDAISRYCPRDIYCTSVLELKSYQTNRQFVSPFGDWSAQARTLLGNIGGRPH